MKRLIVFLGIAVLLMALLLSACGGENIAENPEADQNTAVNEEQATIEIEDAMGTVLELDAPAVRIVSLSPSTTEILFAIGAGDQVVGREDFADYPAEALDVPSIGSTYGEINTEAVLALQPDLVMVAPLTATEQVAALTDVGLTVFMMPNPTTIEDLYEVLRWAGEIAGKVEEAEVLIADLQERVAAVEEVIAGAETTPLVFYELDSTEPAAPWTTGPGTFIDTLIRMAGGENIAGDMQGDWVQISAEEIIARDPEVILLGDAIWGVTPEAVAERPGWETISAVANGQVFPFDDNLASRPGPRLVDGLEEMARLIHPELFD